jgi:hypothetical protein
MATKRIPDSKVPRIIADDEMQSAIIASTRKEPSESVLTESPCALRARRWTPVEDERNCRVAVRWLAAFGDDPTACQLCDLIVV